MVGKIVGLILIMIALYVFSSLFFVYEENRDSFVLEWKDCLKVNKKNILVAIQIIIVGAVGFALFIDKGLDIISFYKYLIVFTLIFDAVLIDIEKQLIPNLLCLVMLAIVLLINSYQILQNMEAMSVYIINYAIGGGLAFIIFFVAKLISRNGIGAGDIKLMTVIGLCVGYNIIDVIFYILLVAFCYSVFMLITRKAKLKDSLPMAPFIYIGFMAYFIMNLC